MIDDYPMSDIYIMWQEQAIIEYVVWSLNCLLPVLSFVHLPLGPCSHNKMVLWPGCKSNARCNLCKKLSLICVVHCKKEILFQPLSRCGVECTIQCQCEALHACCSDPCNNRKQTFKETCKYWVHAALPH